MNQEKQTAEGMLKSKGITPLTKHHDYDYLYCSVVDLLTEQAKEIEELKEVLRLSEANYVGKNIELTKEIERLKGENEFFKRMIRRKEQLSKNSDMDFGVGDLD